MEVAPPRLAGRSTLESGRGATSRSTGSAEDSTAVDVTGVRIISGDRSGFGRRSLARGGRGRGGGEGAGDGELGGVIRFAVSIVSCWYYFRAEKQATHAACVTERTYVPAGMLAGVQVYDSPATLAF